jgi:hypothetical protein
MSIAIQLSEAPELDPGTTEYREGFRRYVIDVLGPDANVVVSEIHPHRLAELEKSWVGHSNTRFEQVKVTWSPTNDLVGYWNPTGGVESPVSSSERAARRYSPNSTIEPITIPALTWHEWLERLGLSSDTTIDLLSVDLDEESLGTAIEMINGIGAIKTLSVGVTNLTRSSRARVDRELGSAGFRKAGRLWGVAGSSQAYSRDSAASSRLASARAQVKTRGGEFISNTRIAREAWTRNRSRAVAKAFNRRNPSGLNLLIDPAPGFPLTPIPRVEIAELARRVEDLSETGAIDRWPLDVAPLVVSDECFRIHGVRPISFSFPQGPLTPTQNPRLPLAPIIPGYPYSFTDHAAYMNAYVEAQLGITHRKAGWDCFRHVEILASGAIPLMVDAVEIPRYTMVHYPKAAMVEVARLVSEHRSLPDTSAHKNFLNHFEQHLTSRSMARYLLEASGLSDARRVLFLDENLPHTADYQSVLTLIGLKQLLGDNCEVAFPVDWIYSDSLFDTSTLYGRGFGYSKILEPSMKSAFERNSTPGSELPVMKDFDALVIGSVTRNPDIAIQLSQEFPPEKTVWIHGEDRPPTVMDMATYVNSGVHVFVRAIEC